MTAEEAGDGLVPGADARDAADRDGETDAADSESQSTYTHRPEQAPAAPTFGRPGWVLVGVLLVSFLVVPPVIVVLPEARGLLSALGLSLRDAYLALPMLPAILLGVTAVWAAVRTRRA